MLITAIALILVVAALLILVVLIQDSKGGGINPNVGATQLIGARRATDWVEKATWVLGVTLFVLCLSANVLVDRNATPTQQYDSPNVRKAKEQGTAPLNVPGQDSTGAAAPATGGDTSQPQP